MIENSNDLVYFSDLHAVSTPLSSPVLVALDDPKRVGELGRFSEALLLNEKLVIPVRGPALELVALVRWFGETNFHRLVESGCLGFVFCPGTLAFVSERNKRALQVRMGPGLEHMVGQTPEWKGVWDSIEEAVAFALHKQLGYTKSASQTLGKRLGEYAIRLDARESFEASISAAYEDAQKLFGAAYGIGSTEDWRRLDHERDQAGVRSLLDVASANLDLVMASQIGAHEICGNEATWNVLQLKAGAGVKGGSATAASLGKILEFEGRPDIPAMVEAGMDGDGVLKMRNSSDSQPFRRWLREIPEGASDTEILKAYYETFKKIRSESVPVKVLRFGLLTVLGFLDPLIGTGASVADALIVDKLINGWNPRLFIEKNFRYGHD